MRAKGILLPALLCVSAALAYAGGPLQASPDVAARMKLADGYFWHAVESGGDEQERWLDKSLTTLESVAREQPRLAEAQAEIGRALGQLALHRGGKEKIKLGLRIKEAAEKAPRLDPSNALANAVMGKWHFELAGLSGIERWIGSALFGDIPDGSYETAAEYLKKAVRLDPGMIYYRLMLARALLKLDAREAAKADLGELLKLKPRVGADHGYLEEARKLLSTLARS